MGRILIAVFMKQNCVIQYQVFVQKVNEDIDSNNRMNRSHNYNRAEND